MKLMSEKITYSTLLGDHDDVDDDDTFNTKCNFIFLFILFFVRLRYKLQLYLCR